MESPLEKVIRLAKEHRENVLAHPEDFSREEVQRAELAKFQAERLQVRDILRDS